MRMALKILSKINTFNYYLKMETNYLGLYQFCFKKTMKWH